MSPAKKPRQERSRSSSTAMGEGLVRAFATMAKVLSQSPSLEMILTTTLDLILPDPRLDAGEIYLLDEKSGELSYAYHRGLSQECVDEAKKVSIKLGQGLTGHVAATKEPIVVLELSQEPRFPREVPKKEGYRALISLPIKSGDRVYGVVNLFSRDGHRLSPRYVKQLADSMEMLGIAFDYVHLLEKKSAGLKEPEEARQRYYPLIAATSKEAGAQAYDVSAMLEILDCFPFYVLLIDAEHHIMLANEAVREHLGLDPKQIVGQYCPKVVHELDHPLPGCPLEEAIKKGHAVTREIFDHKSGRWLDSGIYPTRFQTPDGRAVFLHFVRDITERRMAEEALRASEARYRRLVEDINDGYVVIDIQDGRIVFANGKAAEMLGYEIEELVGAESYRLVAPDLVADVHELRRIIAQGDALPERYEIEALRKDGSKIPIEVSLKALEYQGKPAASIIIRDITERKRAEARLLHLSNAVSMATDSIVIGDLGATIIEVNEATLKMYGTDDKSDLVGKNALDIIAPEDREKALAGIKEVLETGYNENREYHIITKDGSRILVGMNTALLKDADGRPTGFVAVSRDITERKRMEEALRESQERLRALIENAPDAICINDLSGNFVDGNRKAEELIGYSREELIGKNFFEAGILPEEYIPKALEALEKGLRGEPTGPDEFELITKDGSRVFVEVTSIPVASGGTVEVLGIGRDITERKRAEQQIIQHNKELEALYDVASAASQTLDLEELLDNVLAKVLEAMEVEGGLICLFTPKTQELVLRAHQGISEELARDIARIKLRPREIERMIRSEEPLLAMESILNKAGATLLMGLRAREGFRSLAAMPLRSKGVLHGVIAVASHSERRFTPENTGLLHAIANQIAVAIENASLFQDVKDKAERLAVTAELTRIIVSSLDINEVFDAFADGVRRLVDFDRASIALVEEENLRFLAVSSEVETDLSSGAVVPLKDTATAWVVENKRTNIETDFAQSMQFPIDEILFESGLRSAIRLPLFHRGEVFGTFNLSSTRPNTYGQRELEILEELTGQIALAIQNDRLFAEVKQRKEELETAYDQLMATASALDRGKRELESAYLNMARTLVLTLEARDPYTRGHSERVAQISRQIAFEMGLCHEEVKNIETAARLHDLGKIGIPDSILLRPGPLTPSERAEIQRHPTRAVELLRLLGFLDGVLPIVESHHERYNGGGYPESRRGEETPLGARILAVADAYDAMTSARPYRPPMSHEEAIKVLKEGAGKQWDPKVVEAFLRTFDK